MNTQWHNYYLRQPYDKTRERQRRLRQAHRSDGFRCGTCGAGSVRLYRDFYMFLRRSWLRCNRCLESTEMIVPCVTARDGSVWGHRARPEVDITRWYARPDADASPSAPRWVRGDGSPEGWRVTLPHDYRPMDRAARTLYLPGFIAYHSSHGPVTDLSIWSADTGLVFARLDNRHSHH